MATPTFTPLLTYTLSSSVFYFDVTGIPSGYSDLYVAIKLVGSASSYLRFNGDTTNVPYKYQRITTATATGNASASSSAGVSSITGPSMSSTPTLWNIYISQYGGSKPKSSFMEWTQIAGTSYGREVGHYMWDKTAALTYLRIGSSGASVSAGTEIAIYGVN